ncbi:hypothetical protein AAV94_06320 [Lampropedia cohaerens]|uniref:HTH araC/xylS-type domain-containing protein n=1 Tax=Lampropedia cohaerens TaxID=1610491 RepID=A0A0U1Q0A0_9BURK|nr:hypothetical protein AAV94_06320 [Lampropedia cohaerens]
MITVTSPQGLEFTRIHASPQTMAGKLSPQPYSLWISIVDADSVALRHKGRTIRIHRGDIMFGSTGTDASLSIDSDFEMLYIKVPRTLLHHRLLNPTLLGVGHLSASEALNDVFARFLTCVSKNLEGITAHSMRPIEVTVLEFLVSSIAPHTMIEAFGSSGKLMHYQQICDSIENQLKEPNLNLGTIAQQEGVSPRYIQKLFEMAGTSFSQYVRERRLEHCRSELLSKEHRHLSISDICFRWGFNDAAHFSRSFRIQYNESPRACRQAVFPQAA